MLAPIHLVAGVRTLASDLLPLSDLMRYVEVLEATFNPDGAWHLLLAIGPDAMFRVQVTEHGEVYRMLGA